MSNSDESPPTVWAPANEVPEGSIVRGIAGHGAEQRARARRAEREQFRYEREQARIKRDQARLERTRAQIERRLRASNRRSPTSGTSRRERRVEERVAAEERLKEDAAAAGIDLDIEVDEQLLSSADTPLTSQSPPPARLLSLAALLLAPGERENWLGELRTARWELRTDRRARRRETWGYFQALGVSLMASWRFRGDGQTREIT